MRILEKHVVSEFCKSLFASLFVFLFLFVIIDCFSHLEDFMKNTIPLAYLGQYYLTLLPMIFLQTAPIACLLAMIYTIGKLNYHNELIAMRSGGMSTYAIISPILIIGIIISLGSFVVSENILTVTQPISDRIKADYIDKKEAAASHIIKNMAIYGFQQRQIFINSFDTGNNSIEGITILEHDSHQNVISKFYAKKARWDQSKQAWITRECFLYHFDIDNQLKDYRYMEEYKLAIQERPQDFLLQNRQINYLGVRDLSSYINKLAGSGAETAIRNLTIDLYQKIVSPFTCLVMIVIGLPCSMVIRRKAVGFSSVGIGILIALLYYVVQAISIALGKNTVFPAIASVLITPIIFIGASFYLISASP